MGVLIIEHNKINIAILKQKLERHGFSVDVVYSFEAAEEFILVVNFDAIVVDLLVSDVVGREWVASRRLNTEFPPVMIISDHVSLFDRIAGLDAGAEDCLEKPFAVAELAARLRVLMRRPGPRQQSIKAFGQLSLNTTERCATFEGEDLKLARREVDLLELLLRTPGQIVRRSTIENALYNYDDDPVTPNAVEAVVSRLRRKLAIRGASDLVVTLRGLGYRLQAGVATALALAPDALSWRNLPVSFLSGY